MNIYQEKDYRVILKTIVAERKKLQGKFSFVQLAEAARVQQPYLSKVLKNAAELSSDQMFLIANFLGMSSEERNYMLLLVEYERSSLDLRKKEIAGDIEKMREKHLTTSAYVAARVVETEGSIDSGLNAYYLDPHVQIVHVGLSIDRYAANPNALAIDLGLQREQMAMILDTLERIKLITRDKQQKHQIKVKSESIHLPKESPVYRLWRSQLKIIGLAQMNRNRDKDQYSFSTVFSASESVRSDIQARFMEFLKSCESSVLNAKAKKVYQMSFDLFPWTN